MRTHIKITSPDDEYTSEHYDARAVLIETHRDYLFVTIDDEGVITLVTHHYKESK